MKKHFITIAVAVFLAVLLTVITPMKAYAASKTEYVSEIRMSYSTETLENLGYTVLNHDLNKGTSWYDVTDVETRSEYSYIGYKTTTDPDEAITDISIMDMKGGYSFGDYEEILKQREKEISLSVDMFRDMLDEFAVNYTAGSPAAIKAHAALNNYIEDDSGRLVGDLFLDATLSDDDLIKIYMQSSMIVLYCLQTAVTVGLSNYQDESIIEKLSALGPVETEIDYFDEAEALYGNLGILKDSLSSYLSVSVTLGDADALEAYLDGCTDEETADYTQNAILYNLLDAYEYGDSDMTLADFFLSDDLGAEDIYPLVSVMTKGQYSAARLCGFLTLFLSSNNDADAYAEAERDITSDIEEPSEPISIYMGTDRSMYEGGVAITSEVQRKSAATGDSSWAYYSNLDFSVHLALLITLGISSLTMIVFGGTAFMLSEITGITLTKLVMSSLMYRFITALSRTPVIGWIVKAFSFNGTYTAIWTSAGAFILYASLAIIAITLIVYFSIYIVDKNDPVYTEVPLILMDLKYGESDEIGDWEKYVKYNVVRDENGNAADLNCFMGKHWNAMYVTKDRAAGYPILANSFKVQYGDSATPHGHEAVHGFGKEDAFNLNEHCFNDTVKGIFMFFERDSKAYASDTASVFTTGELATLTGFGGLVAGAWGAVLIGRRKNPAAV